MFTILSCAADFLGFLANQCTDNINVQWNKLYSYTVQRPECIEPLAVVLFSSVYVRSNIMQYPLPPYDMGQ